MRYFKVFRVIIISVPIVGDNTVSSVAVEILSTGCAPYPGSIGI
jgi:hypothetical protein